MKKSFIAILISLALLLTLTACNSDKNGGQEADNDTETTEEGETQGFKSADGKFEFNADCFVADEEESSYSDNECTFIKATYEILSLTDEAKELYPELSEALEAINSEVRERATDVVREYMDSADEDYAENPEKFLKDGGCYTYEYKYSPIYVNGNYVSLSVEDYCYMGGAHPTSSYYAYTINVTTGESAKIGDFVTDTNALVDAIAEKLDRYYGGGLYYTDDELKNYIMCTFTGESFNGELISIPWNITEKGLAFYFGDYAVAPYASGSFICEINTSEFPDLFK